MDFSEKTQRCQHLEELEEERRKIQVFQRELPLCLDLVTQAIEAYRRELSGTTTDCSEQTSSDVPVLEEFIPIKRSEEKDDDRSSNKRSKNDKDHKRKSDWLRSTQLWNQSPDPSLLTHKEEVPRKATVTEVKRNGTGGAFQPFQRDKGKTSSDKAAVPASTTSSSAETVASGGGNSQKEDKDSGGQRKQRRCWSPELHRRFLHALQQLGGSHAATPKQIRDLMKVDGLTNDEVKSHLQKYRLHTRRPSPTIHNSSNPQAPQFVVVGGIWVPPQEFTAASDTASKGIYAPVASTSSLPPPLSAAATSALANNAEQQRVHVSEGDGSETEGGHVLCNSSATSSSTHTTTTSPEY